MKNPSTPIIILLGFCILLINLAVHTIILLLPHIKRLVKALYRGTTTYTSALLVVSANTAQSIAYYCYPLDDEGFVDTFLGVAIADLGWAIATVSGRLSRICE